MGVNGFLRRDLSNVELRARDSGSISHKYPAGLGWGAREGLSLGCVTSQLSR